MLWSAPTCWRFGTFTKAVTSHRTPRKFTALFLNVLLIGLVCGQHSEDVVRVKTELVQTDVTVVDKRGRFVSGLSVDELELRVDSKLQPLSFFEEVTAGSVDEEKQLAAARKGVVTKLQTTSGSATDRGRVIFFFVDDVHLTGDRTSLALIAQPHARTGKAAYPQSS